MIPKSPAPPKAASIMQLRLALGKTPYDECGQCEYWRNLSGNTSSSNNKCCHYFLDNSVARERSETECYSFRAKEYISEEDVE